MPLTEKGAEIKKNMEEQYGKEKGEQVFYASKNKGTITGVDHQDATVWSPSYRRGHLDEGEERRIQPGDIEEGNRTYGPQWGEECQDEVSHVPNIGDPESKRRDEGLSAASQKTPFSSTKANQPPPSQISGLAGARDQATYKPAGPENLSLEAINKRNREYWAPEWQRRK